MKANTPQAAGCLSRLTAELGVALKGCRISAYDAGDNTKIESVQQANGEYLWAVRAGNNVLNHDASWEWEPTASGRDKDFLKRCRFETPQLALAVLSGYRNSA